MKKVINRILGIFLTVVLLILSCTYIGDHYMPAQLEYGATWNMYTKEPKQSIDVIVLGPSYAYCSTIPAEIYRTTKITAYNVCGPALTMSLSKYYLQEALKTQSPRAVYLEATSMFFAQYTDYTKVNVGYMPWGMNRLCATFFASEKEQRLGLLFPLYNYHDRWSEVGLGSLFTEREDEKIDPLAGYTYLAQYTPQSQRQERSDTLVNFDSQAYAIAQHSLADIKALCDANGIALYLYLAPAAEYLSAQSMQLLQNSADTLGITLYNFNTEQSLQQIGLNLQTDCFDARHLNISGARKFSALLAQQMQADLSKLPGDAPTYDTALWDSRVAYLQTQQNERPLTLQDDI